MNSEQKAILQAIIDGKQIQMLQKQQWIDCNDAVVFGTLRDYAIQGIDYLLDLRVKPDNPLKKQFPVALEAAQEARFTTWVGVEYMTPWERSVARLALLLNTTQRGLIDYSAAQHFANELVDRINKS